MMSSPPGDRDKSLPALRPVEDPGPSQGLSPGDRGIDRREHLPAPIHLPGAFAGDLQAPGAPVAGRDPPGVSGVMQGIPGISHSQREPGGGVVSVGALPCMPASERVPHSLASSTVSGSGCQACRRSSREASAFPSVARAK